MVTMLINDKDILAKYNTDEIIWKMSIFFKEELWVEDELILCSTDLDSNSSWIKKAYYEAKSMKDSEFIDY